MTRLLAGELLRFLFLAGVLLVAYRVARRVMVGALKADAKAGRYYGADEPERLSDTDCFRRWMAQASLPPQYRRGTWL